jgi:cellulase/cellobiase CelA1
MLRALILIVTLIVVSSQNPYNENTHYFRNVYDANRFQETIEVSTGQTKDTLKTVQGTAFPFWIAEEAAMTAGWTRNFLQAASVEEVKQLVTIVVYDIPNRDCSATAGGGEICCKRLASGLCDNTAIGPCTEGLAEYKQEVIDPLYVLIDQYDELVDIVIILEPDALANLGTGSCRGSTPAVYKDAIAYAIRKFATTKATVYLDAGHPGWLNKVDVVNLASILNSMDFEWDMIRGFSLNLANSKPLGTWCGNQADVVRYCATNPNAVCCADTCQRKKDTNNVLNFAQLYRTTFLAESGGTFSPHMVIDTSRNGVDVCTSNWCNIRDLGIGSIPTHVTSAPDLVDAYIWIKIIGDSDGCTRYLPSGALCPAYDAACGSVDSMGSRAGEPRAPLPGTVYPSLLQSLANNAVWRETECIGPYEEALYPKCENKIQWNLANRDSAWFALKGLDITRCSLQGYLYENGAFCPAGPTAAPVVGPTVPVEPCSGPYDDSLYPVCDNKIVSFQASRSSAWLASKGLDGSRCSLQEYFYPMGFCPAVDCPGPFAGFAQCEIKIIYHLENKDSAWFATHGLDGSRCSLQGWLYGSNFCPAPPSKAPIALPTSAPTLADCPGPFAAEFPDCEKKIQWMLTKDSAFYVRLGLDGSRCSIQGFYNAKDQSCPGGPSEAPMIAPTASPTLVDCPGPFDGYDMCASKIDWFINNRDSAWFAARKLDGSRCSLQKFLTKSGICPAEPCSGPYPGDYDRCVIKVDWTLANRPVTWFTDNDIDGSRCSVQQYYYENGNYCPSTATDEPIIGVFYFFWTGNAIVLPPGANMGVAFSGRGDVADCLSLNGPTYNSLPGSKFLSIGGVPLGDWSTVRINLLNAAITAGDLDAYSGIAYFIMEGEAGLSAAFAASFALAKSKGFTVLITFSHSGPYGITDNVKLVQGFISDSNIDILSPRLFDTDAETVNNYDQWPVPWAQFTAAKAKFVPCVVRPSLYPAAQAYFAALSIETKGYIQWSQTA